MRLDRELGTLNREIIAIKEKWKIALNIDSKKVAIERLITKRKRLRDSGEISQMVETAIKEERKKAPKISPPKPQRVSKAVEKERIIPKDINSKIERSKTESSKKPDHLTVSWLKNRMRVR